MTHTLANGIRICTVDCPEGLNFIGSTYAKDKIVCSRDEELVYIDVPPGNWTLLGRFEEITEETWRDYLDKEWDGSHHWFTLYDNSSSMTKRAPESARSLIPGNPVVLIEKK